MLTGDIASLTASARVVLYSFAILDCLRNNNNNINKDLEVTWDTFVNWVLAKHGDRYGDTFDHAVATLLKSVCGTRLIDMYSVEAMKEKLCTKSNERNFRVVAACYPRLGEKDGRVRTLLEQVLLSADCCSPSPDLMSCPSFTSIAGSVPRRCTNKPFQTGHATRFIQLLHISVMCQLQCVLRNSFTKKRCRNIERTTSSFDKTKSPLNIPSLTTLRDPVPQKIGYTIHKVTKAWDCFVQSLGFRCIESFVKPYIFFTGPMAQIEHIQERDDGFPPKSQEHCVQFDISLTNVRNETYLEAFDRVLEVDTAMRMIVKDFVNDLYEAINSSACLYTSELQSPANVRFFEKYKSNNLRLPSRFICYASSEHMQVISRHMKTPNQPEVSQDYQQQHLHATCQTKSTGALPPSQNTVSSSLDRDHFVKTLEEFMSKGPVRMFAARFQDLRETFRNKAKEDDSLEARVQLVVTNPPQEQRCESFHVARTNQSLSKEDRVDFVNFVAEALRPGGHVVVFCPENQFHLWFDLFDAHGRGETDLAPFPSKGNNRTFLVDAAPLHFLCHPPVVPAGPVPHRCLIDKIAEYAMHAEKNGGSREQETFKSFGHICSTNPHFFKLNVLDNLICAQPDEESAIDNDASTKMETHMPRRRQAKCSALLQDLICRFSRPNDIVLDPFAATISTANACFTLREHRKFIGCEMDSASFRLSKQRLVEQFATSVTAAESNIVITEQVLMAARNIYDSMAQREMNDQWMALSHFPLYQRFPSHIISLLACKWECMKFFIQYRNVPLHKWPTTFQRLFQQVEPLELRQAESAATHVMVAKSTIKHPDAGMGLFATKTFLQGETIASYYGILVYHDFGKETSSQNEYGSGIMAICRDRFHDYAMLLPLRSNNRDFDWIPDLIDGKTSVCIVPPSFCAAAYINDYRYDNLDQDYDAYKTNRVQNKRSPNVIFLTRNGYVSSVDELIDPGMITVKATEKIYAGNELFANYERHNFMTEKNKTSGTTDSHLQGVSKTE